MANEQAIYEKRSLLGSVLLAIALMAGCAAFVAAENVRLLVMEGVLSGQAPAYGEFARLVAKDAAEYWTEVSYGQLQVTYQVAPPFEVPAPGSCSGWNPDALRFASSLGLDGTNLVFISSGVGTGCPFGANADPGGRTIRVWGAFNGQQLAHELGHNFGLGHSTRYNCQGKPFHPINCGQQVYGDPYDVMSAAMTYPSADHLLRLSFLPPNARLVFGRKNGVIRLEPLEVPPPSWASPGLRQALVERADGFQFALERRDPIGRDAGISRRWILRMVHGGFVTVIMPGETWTDTTGGLDFALSADGTAMTVTTFVPAVVTQTVQTPSYHPGFPEATPTPFINAVPCIFGRTPMGEPCTGPQTFTPTAVKTATRTPLPPTATTTPTVVPSVTMTSVPPVDTAVPLGTPIPVPQPSPTRKPNKKPGGCGSVFGLTIGTVLAGLVVVARKATKKK